MSVQIHSSDHKKRLELTLGAIGVVFGDIGTSPLYAVKEVFHNGLATDAMHVLGVLSLIFWSLTLVVTTKYAIFIMRADNKGEGGIMALLALTLQTAKDQPIKTRLIVTTGIVGAVLFYGDSVITPAISVLSAVEGLQIIAPGLEQTVIPATLTVLGGLFVLQVRGTAVVGKLFAPVMCVWFLVLATLGIVNIYQFPTVLTAINPYHAIALLQTSGWQGFVIMGSVVLVITGAEALYADMGHFGLKPIRYAWFSFVFPALLLNYFGQGALLIQNPAAIENPFYLLAPEWALYPLLLLATLATVIASQAVISGAFSLSRQAIQLGYSPRMNILHTSDDEAGQIYIPAINWLLMAAVFILVISFKSSTALASAYGLAVTGTMISTTILAFIVIRQLWNWHRLTSVGFLAVFLSFDLLFFSTNSLKIPEGGWLPLVVGFSLFLVISTWIKGREMLSQHLESKRVMFEDLEQLQGGKLVTVSGTGIYLAKNLRGVPQVLLHNLEHNHALHQQLIVLTVVTTDEPKVSNEHRIKIRYFGEHHRYIRIKLYFGFHEPQDVGRALRRCKDQGLELDLKNATFFVGSERVSFRRRSPMPKWRRELFRFLVHNSSSASEYFRIPIDRVVEVGVRVEL